MTPTKQRSLASSLGAVVIELDCDHDGPVTGGKTFGHVTRVAVDVAAQACGTMHLLAGETEMPARIADVG